PRPTPHPHSLPTRRSSDLSSMAKPSALSKRSLKVSHLPASKSNLTNTAKAKARSCEETGSALCALNDACVRPPLVCSRFEIASRDRKSTRLNSSHDQISYA